MMYKHTNQTAAIAVISKQVNKKYIANKSSKLGANELNTRPEWVKLVYSETPTKANVKQGYLYDEGDFFKVVGDTTETLVRKLKVISITKKTKQRVRHYENRINR